MVNPLSSMVGIALFGFAAARPALVNVSPTREEDNELDTVAEIASP